MDRKKGNCVVAVANIGEDTAGGAELVWVEAWPMDTLAVTGSDGSAVAVTAMV